MANLNKVMLIGRLTRDPESRAFTNGGKVTKFGFAANNRAKNNTTGQWEDVPMFIDVKIFNRGEFGRKADVAEQYLSKGQQVFIEGHLVLEQWDDKETGQKRSKHVVVADNFEFLSPRPDGGGNNQYQQRSMSPAPVSSPAGNDDGYDPGFDTGNNSGGGYNTPPDSDIPF